MAQRRTPKQKWTDELEAGFLAAYDAHSDALFRHCLIRVRDREVAKDIVQEAYSKTWVYLSEGNEVRYIKAFLYRVANNLIIDLSRKKKSSSLDAMMEDDGFEAVDDTTEDPSVRMKIREALAELHKLDEIYRVVITMRYLDELPPREIASVLGVSENVVSVRIHRGIQMLGNSLKKDTP